MAPAQPFPADPKRQSVRHRASERPRLASCCRSTVIDLDDAYRQLASQCAPEQLAIHYDDANRTGARDAEDGREPGARPIAILAKAIPPAATLNVAIYALHLVPRGSRSRASEERVVNDLLDAAGRTAAAALHRTHRALEADGAAHGYPADEWLPTVYDITAELLESARLDSEPPTLVRAAQDAISWLSRAVVELDQDSADTPHTLVEALARLLAGWVFANEARAGGSKA